MTRALHRLSLVTSVMAVNMSLFPKAWTWVMAKSFHLPHFFPTLHRTVPLISANLAFSIYPQNLTAFASGFFTCGTPRKWRETTVPSTDGVELATDRCSWLSAFLWRGESILIPHVDAEGCISVHRIITKARRTTKASTLRIPQNVPKR
jgi:hypothetical protein